MDVTERQRARLKDEHINRCLEELRKIRKQISEKHTSHIEIIDPGFPSGLGSERTVEGKLERLSRACIWHAVSLKTEFKLKLLYTIDGYLSATDAKNPMAMFLLARSLLELAATISAIDFDLQAATKIDFHDWQRRTLRFLAPLYVARHSTSDPRFKTVFLKAKIPESLTKPIYIGAAIKKLATRPGFDAAVSDYDMLSNMCHHNGSGHKFFAENMRETKVITALNGRRIVFKEKAAVRTVGYPSSEFSLRSLVLTAHIAWWSANSANKMIEELQETPFNDDELNDLTRGRLTNRQAAFPKVRYPRQVKVGRNDPCPCGSGKKYKICCLREVLKSR